MGEKETAADSDAKLAHAPATPSPQESKAAIKTTDDSLAESSLQTNPAYATPVTAGEMPAI